MASMNSKDAAIALICAGLLGLNVVSSKMGVAHFPPFLFAALRFLVCVPLLCFFPLRGISLKYLAGVSFLMGILYLGGMNLALYTGTSAGVTILFAQISVFIMIILAAIFLKERPKAHHIIGICLGIVGIFFIASSKGFVSSWLGLLGLLASTSAYAFGTILIKKQRFNPLALNVWIACFSVLPMFLISLIFENNLWQCITSATPQHWGMVLFAGYGSMLLAGAGFTYLVNKYSLTAVTPFRLSTPVFGIVFAVLFLAESYAPSVWAGAILTLVGVTIAQVGHLYKKNKVAIA